MTNNYIEIYTSTIIILFLKFHLELTSCTSKELKIKRQKQEWKYKASESCSWTPGYTDNFTVT